MPDSKLVDWQFATKKGKTIDQVRTKGFDDIYPKGTPYPKAVPKGPVGVPVSVWRSETSKLSPAGKAALSKEIGIGLPPRKGKPQPRLEGIPEAEPTREPVDPTKEMYNNWEQLVGCTC